MKVGDPVKLIGVPPGLPNREDLPTRSVLEQCLGRTFVVQAIEIIDGLVHPMIALHVGSIDGAPDIDQSIWVEPEYLELCRN